MNHQSDYGYSTGAVSNRCIACGSMDLNCCDGTLFGGDDIPNVGQFGIGRYTHRIVNEDGQFIEGCFSRDQAEEALHSLRADRDTAHNFYEIRTV